jgi:hypothetical protein
MTCYWSDLLPDMPANMPYTITAYENVLQYNKGLLNASCDRLALSAKLRALLSAMAMVETTTFSSSDRDASKDANGDAANVSFFNLNICMVKAIDPTIDPWSLNLPSNIDSLIRLICKGLKMWGTDIYLNYVRGGRVSFIDGTSYDAYGYRNTIATMLRVIDMYPALLHDNRRINIGLKHV